MAQGELQDVPKTLFWGERGLVSTLFLDLAAGDFGLWSEFLLRMTPPILGELTSAFTIVEPTFGVRAFGSPDAIAVLGIAGENLVLIVEAKREPYLQASWLRTQRGFAGFNSKINGQLELNYRLSLALADFFAELPGDRGLAEPAWLAGTPYAAADPDLPRYVQNPAVLAQVAARFSGLALDRYHHLVITTDQTDPFGDPTLSLRFPQLFNELGEDTWPALRKRFHWISWATVLEFLVGDNADGADAPTQRPGQQFAASYALNLPNFRQPPGPRPAVGGVDRPTRGVMMVRLSPQYVQAVGFPAPAHTFVHFSWRGGAARLRNYYHLPQNLIPPQPRCDDTATILANIVQEVEVPNHPPYTDTRWWHLMTLELNAQFPAAGA